MSKDWKVRIFWGTVILLTTMMWVGFLVWNKVNSLEWKALHGGTF